MMSSFFDKVKQGVNEAGQQAKLAVETNRLKGQISAKEKEISAKYLEIGRDFFQAFKIDDFASAQGALENNCQAIAALEDEIKDIQRQIDELKEDQPGRDESGAAPTAQVAQPAQAAPTGSKTCVCGTEVGAEVKFCPACGNRF
jgi:hypothetical protein